MYRVDAGKVVWDCCQTVKVALPVRLSRMGQVRQLMRGLITVGTSSGGRGLGKIQAAKRSMKGDGVVMESTD